MTDKELKDEIVLYLDKHDPGRFPVHSGNISDALGVTPTAVSEVLSRLDTRELVEVTSGHGKQGKTVLRVTQEGRRYINELKKGLEPGVVQDMVDRVSEESSTIDPWSLKWILINWALPLLVALVALLWWLFQ